MSTVTRGIAAIQRPFTVLSRKPIVAVIALAAASFLLAVVLRPTSVPLRFVSPDEAANFFFAETFSQSGRLWAAEPLNADRPADVAPVAPRSVATIGDRLLPMSFLGLPLLAGLAGAVAGSTGTLLVVPLATAGAIVALFVFLRRLFRERIAFISTVLFLSLPAVIHYDSRPMMHNLLFLDLLVIGAGLFVSALDRRPWFAAFAGLSVGLALLTRTSEAPWVLLVLLPAVFWTRDRWRHWVWAAAGAAVPLLLLAGLNASLYGAPWNFGYRPELSEELFESGLATTPGLVLPFGIHLAAAGERIWDYFLAFAPGWAAFVLLGLGALARGWWRKELTRPQRRYVVGALAVSVWLFLVYGSSTFVEHTNPLAVILSSSYLRYWLPAFVATVPFVAIGVESVAFGRASAWLRVGFFLALVTTSWSLVIGDDIAGSRTLEQYVTTSAATATAVAAAVPANAVTFIQPPSDRVLFPERRVLLVPPADPAGAARSARFFAPRAPLFVFVGPSQEGFLDDMKETAQLLKTNLKAVGEAGDGTLYRFDLL